MNPLKVCIDARLVSGDAGGVEQFVIGLASGLSNLVDGSEQYFFLVYSDSQEWIAPFLKGPCRILLGEKAPQEHSGLHFVKRILPGLTVWWNAINPLLFQKSIPQAKSNGTIEKAGMDIMHFTIQQHAFITDVPSIYHPHDLQQVHLPEMFTLRKRVLRDQMYRTFCNRAAMVAVASNFVKGDLIRHFDLQDEKVKVISLAPVVDTYSEPSSTDLAALLKRYSLPKDFVFYPAQTWPHKNHINLVRSLAFLRDQYGMRISAVFCGKKYDKFYKTIEDEVNRLGLQDQVTFLGFVSPVEVRALYRLCRCVVIPTKFEAGSFPLWEAFLMGVPAACSNVTSLPEQAGSAALLFDPDKPEEIASQIYRLWTDDKLRSELVERGRQNVARFSWERTARVFRAHYRRIADEPLNDEDIALLTAPSLF
jgi:glycosyltransferase involved in cell wall biosynthesis